MVVEVKRTSSGWQWLLWWQISETELDRQVQEYNTLKPWQRSRGQAAICLSISCLATASFVYFGILDASAFVDMILFGVLAVFVYRGGRLPMVLAMALWTIEKGFSTVAGISNGSAGVSPVIQLFWWSGYMHVFYFSYKIEQSKRSFIVSTMTTTETESRNDGINVFEGARRIALVLKMLSGATAIAMSYFIAFDLQTDDLHPSFAYQTTGPNAPFVKTTSSECQTTWPREDGSDTYYYDLGDSYSALIELCFKAQKANNGQNVIPYKENADGTWFGNTSSSQSVIHYIKTREKNFIIPDDDRKDAQKTAQSAWFRALHKGTIYAVGSGTIIISLLTLLQFIIGWIIRGFMGIPQGQDRRRAGI